MTNIKGLNIKIMFSGAGFEYFAPDITEKGWNGFLQNYIMGNETIFVFKDSNGNVVTINPTQCGIIEVKEK